MEHLQKTNIMNELVLCSLNIFHRGQMRRAAPVCDFKGSGRRSESVAVGGSGCHPHTTELVIVFVILVSGPAAVAGAQGPIALLKVYSIQVSTQLEWYRTGPAFPGDSLTGFHLRVRWDRRAWSRGEQRNVFVSVNIHITSVTELLHTTTGWQQKHTLLNQWILQTQLNLI